MLWVPGLKLYIQKRPLNALMHSPLEGPPRKYWRTLSWHPGVATGAVDSECIQRV